MKKGIFISILGFIGIVGTFIIWVFTPEEKYIWNGFFYVVLLIACCFVMLRGLIEALSGYYSKERLDKIREKYKDKYDASKSIMVNIQDLIYYVNIKFLGGDKIVIKNNDSFHVLERQVYKSRYMKNFLPVYSLDENVFGFNYDNLLCKIAFDGKALIELDQVEVCFMNNKYPFKLTKKRNYDNVKPHNTLMGTSIFLLIIGFMFALLAIGKDDWYRYIIFGGIMIIIGIILFIDLIKTIDKESIVE